MTTTSDNAGMCGRYAMVGPQSRYQEHFEAQDLISAAPRYNVAPSQEVPVIRQDRDGGRHFVLARWGLVPSWCKDLSAMQRPINAKAETAAIKPMFRDAFRRSRILVPADLFYEWKAIGRTKQPYAIGMRDGSAFGIAGLLERWVSAQGELVTFAILTTDANALVCTIHGRMPAIIQPEHYARWLDPGLSDMVELQKMLEPYPDRMMRAYAVSPMVSNPAVDVPELMEPLEPQP